MINPEKRWLEKFSMDYPSEIFANYQKFNSKVKAKKRITHDKEIYSQTSILHLNSNREYRFFAKSINMLGDSFAPDIFVFHEEILQITGYHCFNEEIHHLRKHSLCVIADLILEYFSLIADWNTNDNQIAYARSIDKRHEILCYIENLYGKQYPNFPLGYKK